MLDRTGLILEIFGRRARTKEGALQVELAHLTYQRTRLVRSWTHLERQRGGFGFLGGPGESQLEIDRRLIEERIVRIETELEKVKKRRKLHRDSRARVPYPIAALVGYTNAGKSTLFNRLTKASVLEADMLFATLDPTLRAVALPSGLKIIVSDTVGFISDLPTMLVAAFRATLEEVIEADVILHVRDASHADTDAQSHDVEEVLRALGIEIEPGRAPDRSVEQDRPARCRKPRRARQSGGTHRSQAGPGFRADRGGGRRARRCDRDAARHAPRRARPDAQSGGRRWRELAAPPHRGDWRSLSPPTTISRSRCGSIRQRSRPCRRGSAARKAG